MDTPLVKLGPRRWGSPPVRQIPSDSAPLRLCPVSLPAFLDAETWRCSLASRLALGQPMQEPKLRAAVKQVLRKFRAQGGVSNFNEVLREHARRAANNNSSSVDTVSQKEIF